MHIFVNQFLFIQMFRFTYTYQLFITFRYMHLLTNLIFQLVLGLPLEIVHKWWRLMIVYFAGTIGGSLAHSVTDFSVNLVGASGGCYALVGAHMASVVVVNTNMRVYQVCHCMCWYLLWFFDGTTFYVSTIGRTLTSWMSVISVDQMQSAISSTLNTLVTCNSLPEHLILHY